VVARSPAEFLRAIQSHPLDEPALDDAELARARQVLAEAGLLLVGEAHGVRETPNIVYALGRALDTRVLAFEWSHEETESVVQAFVGVRVSETSRNVSCSSGGPATACSPSPVPLTCDSTAPTARRWPCTWRGT
jgi:hypothetical protein